MPCPCLTFAIFPWIVQGEHLVSIRFSLSTLSVAVKGRPSAPKKVPPLPPPSPVPWEQIAKENKKEVPKRDAHALAPSADRQSQREPRWIAQSLSTGNLKYALPRIGEYEMRKWSPPICKRETFQLGTQFHPTRERPFRGFL